MGLCSALKGPRQARRSNTSISPGNADTRCQGCPIFSPQCVQQEAPCDWRHLHAVCECVALMYWRSIADEASQVKNLARSLGHPLPFCLFVACRFPCAFVGKLQFRKSDLLIRIFAKAAKLV